jgi:hypothetical protein
LDDLISQLRGRPRCVRVVDVIEKVCGISVGTAAGALEALGDRVQQISEIGLERGEARVFDGDW